MMSRLYFTVKDGLLEIDMKSWKINLITTGFVFMASFGELVFTDNLNIGIGFGFLSLLWGQFTILDYLDYLKKK